MGSSVSVSLRKLVRSWRKDGGRDGTSRGTPFHWSVLRLHSRERDGQLTVGMRGQFSATSGIQQMVCEVRHWLMQLIMMIFSRLYSCEV